jgi:hypothetical protein
MRALRALRAVTLQQKAVAFFRQNANRFPHVSTPPCVRRSGLHQQRCHEHGADKN